MKQLLIVRHAKSSWDYAGLDDYQRPLLEKGRKKIRSVIDFLLSEKIKPDMILSSHAVRALDTAKIIARGLGIPEDKIIISKSIYHGDAEGLSNHFYDLPKDITCLMIVGHNPTLTHFSNYFLDKKIDNLPTSGAVCIEFETDTWNNVNEAERKVRFVISPKELMKIKSRKNKK